MPMPFAWWMQVQLEERSKPLVISIGEINCSFNLFNSQTSQTSQTAVSILQIPKQMTQSLHFFWENSEGGEPSPTTATGGARA